MSNTIENIEFFISQSKSNFGAAREAAETVIKNGWTLTYSHMADLMESQARYEMGVRLEQILVVGQERGDSEETIVEAMKGFFQSQISNMGLTSRSTSLVANVMEDYQREALLKAHRLANGQTW